MQPGIRQAQKQSPSTGSNEKGREFDTRGLELSTMLVATRQ
jgi:hypothetical protein